jgi:hypothetical protein
VNLFVPSRVGTAVSLVMFHRQVVLFDIGLFLEAKTGITSSWEYELSGWAGLILYVLFFFMSVQKVYDITNQ